MENKNYYYLKLKENFFESDELKILESQENGYLYSNILLKLYLKALKNDGKLVFNEYIPYNAKMLATITGHNIDIVEKAIKVFQALHLIEILDNGTIFMLDMQKMIGSISSEGIRKAKYRERINIEKNQSGTIMGQSHDILSYSNSNSKSNIYNNKEENQVKEERHKHGEYGWIKLTDEQYNRLKSEYSNIDKVIDRIDEYVQSNGNKNKYKDWNLVIRKAIREKWSCLNDINNRVTDKVYTKEELDSFFSNLDDVEV